MMTRYCGLQMHVLTDACRRALISELQENGTTLVGPGIRLWIRMSQVRQTCASITVKFTQEDMA